jgi:oligoribonuclease (3'-5' exoribonuclease)
MKYIAYDCETGGLFTDKSLLTLYIVVLDENFRTLEEMDLKLRPDNSQYVTTIEAMKVNNIDLDVHHKQAVGYTKASRSVADLLSRHSNNGEEKLVSIGTNIPFDKAFIRQYLVPNLEDYVSHKNLDVGNIFEFLKLTGHVPYNASSKLGEMASLLKVKVNADLHTAREDTLVAVRVLKRMVDRFSK